MSKFDFGFEGSELSLSIDLNDDGQESVAVKLDVSEAIQEALQNSKPVEGAKLVDFSFDDSKLKLKIDSDKDGDTVLELSIDLMEAFDEILSAIKKA